VGAVLSSAVIQFGESKGDPNDLGTIILQSGISSNESVFFSVDGGTTFKDLNSISADDPDIDCDDLTGTSITVAVNTTAGNTTAVGDIPAGICTG